MTKAEILLEIQTLSQAEDILAERTRAKDLVQKFNQLSAEERKAQEEAWNAEEHEEGEDLVLQENELNAPFEEALEAFRAKAKDAREKIAEEQRKNLEVKLAVIKELETLIAEEENIGKAFNSMKEIQEKWNAVGNVPGNNYRETMDTYQRLKEDFYYNINIYKQLQEHDLKKNEILKTDLIAKAHELKALEDIKEIEVLARSYQKQWFDIGPSPREVYQAQGDAFFGALREGFDKVQAHYDKLKAEYDKNLESKHALVEKVKAINTLEITSHATWQKKTEELLALQEEWKGTGMARRADNEAAWQLFRGECDVFFNKKRAFYDERNAALKVNEVTKTALVEKAKNLQESSDWRATSDELIALQKEWKAVGSAPQKSEQRLWQQFRSACDAFFNRKKDHFKDQDAEYDANLKEKQTLIDELAKTEMTGDRQVDLPMLKSFSERWNAIGFVPRKDKDKVYKAYNALLDERYGSLNAQRQESNMQNYKARAQKLRSSGEGNAVKREKTILREKIDRLNTKINQYENNVNFFTGAGAEKIKKEAEKNIDKAKREIQDIKEKLKLLVD